MCRVPHTGAATGWSRPRSSSGKGGRHGVDIIDIADATAMSGQLQFPVQELFALVLPKAKGFSAEMREQRAEPGSLETHVSRYEDPPAVPELAINLPHGPGRSPLQVWDRLTDCHE